ncbi:MAG: S8 family serine peptidase [Reichenbachiella sp.]
MMKKINYFIICLCCVVFGNEPQWFLNALQVPVLPNISNNKELVIAVVDDAFNLEHPLLKEWLFINPGEKPFNTIDDDANGAVDDLSGWDVSDWDADVSIPEGRGDVFYHGSHVTGIITQILSRALDSVSREKIKILPVKTLSDNATQTYLKDGFKGVEYAISAGADIIVCSWSVTNAKPSEKKIIQKALSKGILVVGAVPNFSGEQLQYPAAQPGVLAVSGIDSLHRKLPVASYGSYVDISAYGKRIFSASSRDTHSLTAQTGTSMAAPMVAAVAALVSITHPAYSNTEIKECILSGAEPIDHLNPYWSGKLGAGSLNAEKAIACDVLMTPSKAKNRVVLPKGNIRVQNNTRKKIEWDFSLQGAMPGIDFYPKVIDGASPNAQFVFFDKKRNNKKLKSIKVGEFKKKLFIPSTEVSVEYITDAPKNDSIVIGYAAHVIDSSRLYCKDDITITRDTVITDGSGDRLYTGNADCRWLFTAPKNNVCTFTFLEFDTEAKMDGLYFFDGHRTNGSIMARYSGNALPRPLTSWGNKALLWFVSNDSVHKKGWKIKVSLTQPQQTK